MNSFINKHYFGDRHENVAKFHKKHYSLIRTAKGSDHNHQYWAGGYKHHLAQCFQLAEDYYQVVSQYEVPFSLQSAMIVLYFHDLEKVHKPNKIDKNKWFNEILPNEYNIKFSPEEQNALKYIHGENEDYSGQKRVMNELAAFCHVVDTTSARIFWNKRDI